MVSKSPWRVPIIAPPTPTPCLPPNSTQKWHFPPKMAIFDYFKKESGSISAKKALGLWGMVSKSLWRVPIIAPPTPTPCLPPNSTQKWHFPPKKAIFDYFKKESGSISAKKELGLWGMVSKSLSRVPIIAPPTPTHNRSRLTDLNPVVCV